MKLSLLFGFLLLVACSGLSENECETDECNKQRAYDRVIAKHDEVMPKLTLLSQLKEQIEKKIDVATDTLVLIHYNILMTDLDKADEGMWRWMRQFDSDLESLSVEEALQYLEEEEAKIDDVASTVNGAISQAEESLK